MLASQFSLLIWIIERVDALAQRLKNGAILVHLIETRQKLTGDVLKLIFFRDAEGRPELMQTVMLRR